MAYDKNWLQKAKAKQISKDLRSLSHLYDDDRQHMLCGKGFFNGIRVVQFPSVNDLPGCRACRELYLQSIGVEADENGYPVKISNSI